MSNMAINKFDTSNQEEIRSFINDSVNKIPDYLKVSDLKWKYVVRSILRGNNILMTGPSGCGKTLVAISLQDLFEDRPWFNFNLGSTQDARSSLIGNTHYDPEKGTFVAPALFVEAIQTENAIILLDEFSRAHHDAVNILMTVLDPQQRYLRIDEDPNTPNIEVADGVSFIATANIGAEYTATRVIDRAILDRFQVVEMEPLSQEDEFDLLTSKFPDVDEKDLRAVAEIANNTRITVKSDNPKVSTIISTRQSVEMSGMLFDGFSLEEAVEVCVYPFYTDAGGVDSERTYMKQLVQKYVDSGDDPDNLAHDPSSDVGDDDNLPF